MELTRTEADNIMNMLSSDDKENGYLAFKAIEAHQFTDKNIGYLVYFYKFSKYSHLEWKENAPNAYGLLKGLFDLDKVVTYAEGLDVMIKTNVDKEIIDMYLQRHVQDLIEMLKAMGYPTDKVQLNMTLQD